MSWPSHVHFLQAFGYLIWPLTVGMSVNDQGLEKQTILPLKVGPGDFMSQTSLFPLNLRGQ